MIYFLLYVCQDCKILEGRDQACSILFLWIVHCVEIDWAGLPGLPSAVVREAVLGWGEFLWGKKQATVTCLSPIVPSGEWWLWVNLSGCTWQKQSIWLKRHKTFLEQWCACRNGHIRWCIGLCLYTTLTDVGGGIADHWVRILFPCGKNKTIPTSHRTQKLDFRCSKETG